MNEIEIAPPTSFDDPGEIVSLPGLNLWCSDIGDGDVITMLGGMTAGHHIWDFVRPHLSDFRTITWEPRGIGLSDRPPPPYGVDVWAQDLKALLDARGVRRTHLWATGFGTLYAIRFAALWPEMVESMIMGSDIWYGDPAKQYDKIWNVMRSVVENFGVTGMGSRTLASIFHVPWLPWFSSWEAQRIEQLVHAETFAATVGYGLTEGDVRDDLAMIQAPVLVLQGDQGFEGRTVRPDEDDSLNLMKSQIRRLDEAHVPDAHPGYVLVHKPLTCVAIARQFFARTGHEQSARSGG